jgi:nicotinamide mononucleotide transporter
MNDFFNLKNIFFTVWDYPMSHLEFWATVSGAVAVYFSAKESVWSWVIGLVNVVLAFLMFYQSQLYPDMFLQIFFFVTNILGFYLWFFPKPELANTKNQLKITALNKNQLFWALGFGLTGMLVLGTFSAYLHELFPRIFSIPSAFPYLDSFTTVASIAATFLLMYKKIESWWTWLMIDILSTYMYFNKDLKLYAVLYFVFCLIAVFAALEWTKKFKAYSAVQR